MTVVLEPHFQKTLATIVLQDEDEHEHHHHGGSWQTFVVVAIGVALVVWLFDVAAKRVLKRANRSTRSHFRSTNTKSMSARSSKRSVRR